MPELEKVPAWLEAIIHRVSEFIDAGPEDEPSGVEWVVHTEEEAGTQCWCVHMSPFWEDDSPGIERFDNINIKVTGIIVYLAGDFRDITCGADRSGLTFEALHRNRANEKIRLLISYVPPDDEEDDDGDGGDELPKPFSKASPVELPN